MKDLGEVPKLGRKIMSGVNNGTPTINNVYDNLGDGENQMNNEKSRQTIAHQSAG